MGGLLAASYAIRNPSPRIKSFIFSSAAFAPGPEIGALTIMAAGLVSSVSPTTRTQTLDPAGISTIESEQERYKNDALNEKEAGTVGLATVLLGGIQDLENHTQGLDLPALYFYGRLDTLISTSGIDDFFERSPNADKTLWVAENSRHEVLNDVDREACISKVSDWIIDHSK